MKKIVLLALLISVLCLAFAGCTPDKPEVETTGIPLPSLVETTAQIITEEPNTEMTEGTSEVVITTMPAETENTTEPVEVTESIQTTEEPEEDVVESYVVDIGDNIGVGGN